jgi:hypothetical protein
MLGARRPPVHALLIAAFWSLLAPPHAPAAPASLAELVRVEGGVAWSLDGFDCVRIAHSTQVAQVCHDARRDVAIAQVDGVHRAWCEVARAEVDAWLASPSPGRHHSQTFAQRPRCG